jgi:hypothetical protein
MKKNLLIILTCLFFLGCNNTPQIINRVNLGKFIESKQVVTSWNETQRIQIITDKGSYFLLGYHSFKLNEDVIINKKLICD